MFCPAGGTLKDAKYIPPSPDDMADAMSDLEKYMNASPSIEIGKTAEALGVSFNTLSAAVDRLMDIGILVKTSFANRNSTFAYEEYLDILREGT